MVTYNTQNPLGSADPRDLYDNAENADRLINGTENSYPDRLGNARLSWAGIESRFADFLANSGYQFLGDYAAGIEITEYNQVVRDVSGEFWRLSGSTVLPYTTTGAGLPEGGAFVSVGDAALRQELATGVSTGQGALRVRGSVIYVDTIADLQALPTSELVDGQQISVKSHRDEIPNYALLRPYVGGGVFAWDATASGDLHNGGTSISPNVAYIDSQPGADERERWTNYLNASPAESGIFFRVPDGSVGIRPEWFGARGSAIIQGSAFVSGDDDYPAFRKIIDIIEGSQNPPGYQGTGVSCIQLDERGYLIGDTIECVGNMRILGASNPKMIGRGPTSFITGKHHMTNGIFFLRGMLLNRSAPPGSQYGFEVDHVGFRGWLDGGNRLPCAIKSDAIGGPARPFNVTACHMTRFDDAIFSDIDDTLPGVQHTGIYNVNITNSVFSYNVNALRGRGRNALGGVVFKGNVSEQGGRILIENEAVMGSVDISDNLLEGQSDAISISMSRGSVRIGTNYWEGNSGIDLDLASAIAASNTSVVIEHQFTIVPWNVRIGRGWSVDIRWQALSTGLNLHASSASQSKFVGRLGHMHPGFSTENLSVPDLTGAGVFAHGFYNESEKWMDRESPEITLDSPFGSSYATDIRYTDGRTLKCGAATSTTVSFPTVSGPFAADSISVLCLRVYRATRSSIAVTAGLYTTANTPIRTTQLGLFPGWNTYLIAADGEYSGDYRFLISGISTEERLAGFYVAQGSFYVMPKLRTGGSPNHIVWRDFSDEVGG